MVVKKIRANREKDALGQTTRHKLGGCRVQVEKRPVVGNQDEASGRVPREKPLQSMHVAKASGRRANPGLTDRALKQPDRLVKPTAPQRRAHQSDLHSLDACEPFL